MNIFDEAALVAFRMLFDPTEWRTGTLDFLRVLHTSPLRTEDTLNINQVTAIAGPLIVEGDLIVNAHLLVLGDLEVGGVIEVPPDHHILIVLGAVRCRALAAMRSYLLVDGDVVAKELALLTTYGAMQCTGMLNTKLCIIDDGQGFYDLNQKETRSFLPEGALVTVDELEGEPFTEALRAAGFTPQADNAFDLLEMIRAGAILKV